MTEQFLWGPRTNKIAITLTTCLLTQRESLCVPALMGFNLKSKRYKTFCEFLCV